MATLLPSTGIMKAAWQADCLSPTMLAFLIYSHQDQMVKASAIVDVAIRRGEAVTMSEVQVAEAVEPSAHVIVGDIIGPSATAPAIATILDGVRRL